MPAALEMAITRCQSQAKVLLHPDRGSRLHLLYQALFHHQIMLHHWLPGDDWDNAASESFSTRCRQWPSCIQRAAPTWCSVDMRDGNQTLIEPMNAERKRRFFDLLVKVGFKEIEVGFPAASQTDFDYIRELIESKAIPEDVTIQVMTQARNHLIKRTLEALEGVSRAIVHVYNATAPVFREVVFGVDRAGCVAITAEATAQIKAQMELYPQTKWTFQYSPETFCFTELDFALEICEAVTDVFQPTPQDKMILNLPTTVEVATANVFADQIEWFCRHFSRRDSVVISVHPHNDRGTAVSTAEQALKGSSKVGPGLGLSG